LVESLGSARLSLLVAQGKIALAKRALESGTSHAPLFDDLNRCDEDRNPRLGGPHTLSDDVSSRRELVRFAHALFTIGFGLVHHKEAGCPAARRAGCESDTVFA